MRGWLNTFRMTVFTPEELELFQTTEVPADSNPRYSTDAGSKTRDSIFLLSVEEILRYLPTDAGKGFGTAWWLRTPGDVDQHPRRMSRKTEQCRSRAGAFSRPGSLFPGEKRKRRILDLLSLEGVL